MSVKNSNRETTSNNAGHPSSSSSQFDTFRSKQLTSEKLMSNLYTGQSEDPEQSEPEQMSKRSNIQQSYREFTEKPIYDFCDKENVHRGNNKNATFNPYKRSGNFNVTHKGREQLESIDLNIRDFDKVTFQGRGQNMNKSSIIENLESPNRSAIMQDQHRGFKHFTNKEEFEEDDEVRQILKDAGINFKTNQSIHKPGQAHQHTMKGHREDSSISSKFQTGGNPHNNSSICLYGTESGHKIRSNYKLNISQLQNYEDDDLHYNDSQLERIGETDREYGSPNDQTREESKQVNFSLRQSHFKDVDLSSLKETKELVSQFSFKLLRSAKRSAGSEKFTKS